MGWARSGGFEPAGRPLAGVGIGRATMIKGHGTRVRGPTMPDRVDDDRYRDLLPSLEGRFASLLARHKEAVGRTEWSYHQFLPFEAFRANAVERPSLSATAYLAVETA